MSINKRLFFVFFIALILCCANKVFAATLHVPSEYETIQAAIDAAGTGDTVLVADGVYTDTNLTWDGNVKHITVKSEDGPDSCIIDCAGTWRAFSFSETGQDATDVIDGFTIKNGSADYGGGIYCSFSSPTITNCMITENWAGKYGGGIYCGNSSPTITNCMIIGNSADYSGGIYCRNSSPTITNCTFTKNWAVWGGGIRCEESSSVTVKNSILWKNNSGSPGLEIALYSSSHLTISYSDVEGGEEGVYVEGGSTLDWDRNSNINEDPLFVNAEVEPTKKIEEDGDYHLSSKSPCIDAGTNDGAPEDDIDGQVRPFNGTVDMGADEYVTSCSIDTENGTVTLSVDNGAFVEAVAVSKEDLPEEGKPELTFPFGFFSFRIIDIEAGGTVTVTLTLPENVPTDAEYWKYGPTLDEPTDHWYQFPFGSNDGDCIITFTITDGGDGDNDLVANGVIIDPGGIGWLGAIPPKDDEDDDDDDGTFNFLGYKCFIATACYGTPMADEVRVLSEFRDECLLTNPVGRVFVNTYYKVSPPIADFISEHPILKNAVRITLQPLIWIVKEFEN